MTIPILGNNDQFGVIYCHTKQLLNNIVKNIINSIKIIKKVEKLFIALIFISLFLKIAFNYKSTLDLFMFSGVLSICYFPLGFYFLGKSPSNNNYIISIALGCLYSTCTVMFLLGCFAEKEYTLFYWLELPTLLIVLLIFGVKIRRNFDDYYASQILRTVFLLIINTTLLLQTN
jgi:peptidoglycan/LPS O-acetylase OafA/YrhL